MSRRGADIQQPVDMTLEEAYHGTARTLEMLGARTLPDLRRHGRDRRRDLPHVRRPRPGPEAAPHRGEDPRRRRHRREGAASRRKGSPAWAAAAKGDLLLVVTVRPHSRFERKGDDLITEIDVPLTTAVLGGEAEVPTVTAKVMLKIPPLTQNGRAFKLGGLGMPHLNKEGQGRPARTRPREAAGTARRKAEATLRRAERRRRVAHVGAQPVAPAIGDEAENSTEPNEPICASVKSVVRDMNSEEHDHEDPVYVISIAARIVGMHAQTLRQYERVGLVAPKRTTGRIRMYSRADIARLRQVQRLMNDLGVNLAGVEVILSMNEKMQQMESEMEQLRQQIQPSATAASRRRGATHDADGSHPNP